MPSSARKSRSSSRICAWIVTSSAVVGSSAIRRRGRHAMRWRSSRAGACRLTDDADIHRRGARRRKCARDQAARSLAARVAAWRKSLMQAKRFADLVADRQDGVKRRHRVLKHHRDIAAADRAQVSLRRAQQVEAGIDNRTGGKAGRAARRAIGASRAPSRSSRCPILRRPQRTRPPRCRRRRRQPHVTQPRSPRNCTVNLSTESEGAHLRPRQFNRGSRTSRNPSPSRLRPSADKVMPRPGNSITHQASVA